MGSMDTLFLGVNFADTGVLPPDEGDATQYTALAADGIDGARRQSACPRAQHGRRTA